MHIHLNIYTYIYTCNIYLYEYINIVNYNSINYMYYMICILCFFVVCVCGSVKAPGSLAFRSMYSEHLESL